MYIHKFIKDTVKYIKKVAANDNVSQELEHEMWMRYQDYLDSLV